MVSPLRKAVGIAWMGFVLLAGPALAQGPSKITLDEAIQLALQHNHNLLASRGCSASSSCARRWASGICRSECESKPETQRTRLAGSFGFSFSR